MLKETNSGEPWHLNGIVYMSAEDTLVVSSKYQSTAYAVHRSRKELLWAVGSHGTIPLKARNPAAEASLPLFNIHHFRPMGPRTFLTFHNNNNLTGPHESAAAAISVDLAAGEAYVEFVIHHPDHLRDRLSGL